MRRTTILTTIFCLSAAFGQQTTTSQPDADIGGYSGPAVLSKAGVPLGQYLGQPISFRWFLNGSGTYSTDLTQPTTNVDGELTSADSFGGTGTVGVYGVKHGPTDTLGANFAAGYRAYAGSNNRRYNGADFRLGLNYARQLSAKTSVQLAVSGNSFGYSSPGLIRSAVTDPIDVAADPTVDGFDGRTTSASARIGISHMLTRRWILSFVGGGSYVERRSDALLSNRVADGGMSVSYLVNATTSVGVGYQYRHFFFPDGFGTSDIHSSFLLFTKQLSPVWNFTGEFGGSRAESERLVAVPLDPIVAAIVGQSAVLEPLHQINYGPVIRATLSRAFQRSSVSLFYSRDFGTGNSFLATSAQDRVGASFSYTATDRLNLGGNVIYSKAKAITAGATTYDSFGGGIGINYRLTRILHFTSSVSYHSQRTVPGSFDRDRFFASVGLTLSPGDRPLSLF